jgi:Kef-type K+ transport system membrane component KefB
MLEEFFFSFGLFSLFSFIGGLIASRWRQPTVVGLLLIGILIGPNFFGFVANNEVIKILSELGIYLLLFSLGLEFSIGNLLGSHLKVIFSFLIIFLALFLIGYEIAIYLLNDLFLAIFFAIAFSFSSTAVFANHLRSCCNLVNYDFSLPAFILILQDLVAITVLTILSYIQAEFLKENIGQNIILLLILPILFSLFVLSAIYILLKGFLEYILKLYSTNIEEENLILFILGLVALLSILSAFIGLSPSIGAFMAGSLISTLPIKKAAKKAISPFSYAFASYFFLSIGLLISPLFILNNLQSILLVSFIFSISAFFISSFAAYLIGYNIKNALIIGAMLSALSEFSLVIGRSLMAFSNFDFVSFFSSILFFTTIFSSFLLKFSPSIALMVMRYQVRLSQISSFISSLKSYILAVISEFEGKGQYFLVAKKTLLETVYYLKSYAFIAAILFLVYRFLGNIIVSIGNISIPLYFIISFLVGILFLPTLLNLFKELIIFADALIAVLSRRGQSKEKLSKRILRNSLLFFFFLITFFILPSIFSVLKLPSFLNFLNLISIFGIIVTIWDTIAFFYFRKK